MRRASSPRSMSCSTHASHRSAGQPRDLSVARWVNVVPVAVCRMTDSSPVRSWPMSAAICPSPRNSRSSVAAAHSRTNGASGPSLPLTASVSASAWAANSGLPSGGIAASTGSRRATASAAAAARAAVSTPSAAKISATIASTPRRRAASTASGAAVSQQAGTNSLIKSTLKL